MKFGSLKYSTSWAHEIMLKIAETKCMQNICETCKYWGIDMIKTAFWRKLYTIEYIVLLSIKIYLQTSAKIFKT